MSKIERYNGDLKSFASEPQGTERTLFGSTTQSDDLTAQITPEFLRGWGIVRPNENPSLQDFSGAMFTATQLIAYIHQMGTPEWNALQEYPTVGATCIHNGQQWHRSSSWAVGDEPGISQSWVKPNSTNLITDGILDAWNRDDSTADGYNTAALTFFNSAGGSTFTANRYYLPSLGLTGIPTAKHMIEVSVISGNSSSSNVSFEHRVESVRNAAGEAVTFSFNAAWDTPKYIAVELIQNFGTGGSPSADVSVTGKKILVSTDRNDRYSLTFDLPDLNGKTLGTNDDSYLAVVVHVDAGSDLSNKTESLGNQSGTVYVGCMSLKLGSDSSFTNESRFNVDRYYQRSTHPVGVSFGFGSVDASGIASPLNSNWIRGNIGNGTPMAGRNPVVSTSGTGGTVGTIGTNGADISILFTSSPEGCISAFGSAAFGSIISTQFAWLLDARL